MTKKYIRVQMLETKEEEPSPGSYVRYAAGEFYNLPEKQAQKYISENVAIDPEAPIEAEGGDK